MISIHFIGLLLATAQINWQSKPYADFGVMYSGEAAGHEFYCTANLEALDRSLLPHGIAQRKSLEIAELYKDAEVAKELIKAPSKPGELVYLFVSSEMVVDDIIDGERVLAGVYWHVPDEFSEDTLKWIYRDTVRSCKITFCATKVKGFGRDSAAYLPRPSLLKVETLPSSDEPQEKQTVSRRILSLEKAKEQCLEDSLKAARFFNSLRARKKKGKKLDFVDRCIEDKRQPVGFGTCPCRSNKKRFGHGFR